MMSTENLLGEAKDEEQPNTRSLKKSIKAELEKHALENLVFGLFVSVVSGAILLFMAKTGTTTLFHWLWFASLCTSSLGIWLWKVWAARRESLTTGQISAIVTTASGFFALLWGLSSPLFLNHEQLEIAAISIALIATLSIAWPLNYAHSPLYRHLFLATILSPLGASLYIYYPQMQTVFIGLVVLFFGVADKAVANYRDRLLEASAEKIKARERSDQIIKTSQKIASLIEQTPLGFIEWNQQREIIGWNPAATTIFGYSKEEALGRTTDFLFDQKKSFLQQQVENDLFLFGKDFTGTAENVTSDGTVITCEWNDTPLFDDSMNVVGAASFVEDVTDRVKLETRIKQQAYFDPLTGLPNRHRLMEELTRVIALAQRNHNYCSLLFIDLDHFKEINDTRGHHYGDQALTLFAQRLRKIIRTEEAVARLGGDEFVVLLENLGREEEASRLMIAQVAEKIIDAAREPFVINEEKFRISCSIGIVLFNDGSSDGDAILQRADKALYTIKREGKSNFYFHNQKPPSELQAQAKLVEQLRNRANNESFIPFYQSILDTQSNLIKGLQIFLRWKNPDNELIPAGEIIEVLESGSMIVDISLSMLEQIFRQLELWRNQDLWREQQKIYFTLSLWELEHSEFIEKLQQLITLHNINSQTLTFGLHAENLPKIHKPLGMQLSKLKKLGCSFIVDNVGHQNLPIQKLRDFDIDTIRISNKLMTEATYMESSWDLVKGLVELAKSVDLKCIAPCIEEPEIHHLLLNAGCQFLQGNLIAPPSPATSITRMLIERNVSQKEESVV